MITVVFAYTRRSCPLHFGYHIFSLFLLSYSSTKVEAWCGTMNLRDNTDLSTRDVAPPCTPDQFNKKDQGRANLPDYALDNTKTWVYYNRNIAMPPDKLFRTGLKAPLSTLIPGPLDYEGGYSSLLNSHGPLLPVCRIFFRILIKGGVCLGRYERTL